MRSTAWKGIALACVAGLPGSALAGPKGSFPFTPFPLAQSIWQMSWLGPSRSVVLTPVDDGQSVRWRVEFESQHGTGFSRDDGSLALDGAPRDCPRLSLQVPDLNFRGKISEAEPFVELRGKHRDHRVAGASERRLYVARFGELRNAPPEPAPIAAPEQCERMRECCAAGAQETRFELGVRYPEPWHEPSMLSPGVGRVRCDAVEQAVERCIEWGEGVVARVRPPPAGRPECEGLLVAARAEDPKNVDLVAVGADGAEWGRVAVGPGLSVHPHVWGLAVLALPVDVGLMLVQGVWWGILGIGLLFSAG